MSKFILTLNSHSLSNLQECESKFKYRDILCIRPRVTKKALVKGNIITRILANYYQRKMKNKNVLIPLNPMMLMKLGQKHLGMTIQESMTFAGVMWDYHKTYQNETWRPIAVEKGFSKLLYEDNENIFVYEGKPDLIVEIGNDTVGIDHKHQSKAYTIFEFNNQAMGYCWSLGLSYFVYNYIKFTKEDIFRRCTYKFTSAQLAQWQSDTVEWFFRAKHIISFRHYMRNWTCQNKFGVCEYAPLCIQPSQSAREWIIKSQFQQVKRYRSW